MKQKTNFLLVFSKDQRIVVAISVGSGKYHRKPLKIYPLNTNTLEQHPA
ncbi:MAG: hypothetical protein RPU64_12985 [Candidatus Sedimenticola sp. (ex Thyasira tokunagai)]